MKGLSILFLTTILPSARLTGGEIVTVHFVEALRTLGHEVRVLGYARAGYRPMEGETFVEHRPIETHDARFQAAIWIARSLARGRAYSVEKFAGTAYQSALTHAQHERRWDAVILDHAQMGWLLPQLEGQRLIHISHNSEAALYKEQASSGHIPHRLVFAREARRMWKVEKSLAHAAAFIWALTEAQCRFFEELGASSVVCLPVPPMNLPEKFYLPKPDFDIGLLGTWSWKSNRVGLVWFCDHVAPLLPDARIFIGGAGADDLRGRFANIEIIGRVPDAAAFLARARVIAVPSIAGDGIQIKTLDAIAIGRPVVTTTFSLRGIGDIPQRVCIADDPQAFAAALSRAPTQPIETKDNGWAKLREERFLSILRNELR